MSRREFREGGAFTSRVPGAGSMGRRQFKPLPFDLIADEGTFCQILYNPTTTDCPWFLVVQGSHTPTTQPDRLDFEAGGTPIAGTDLPWGVQPEAATGVLSNPEHTGIDLTPVADTFNVTLPLGFTAAEEKPCLKTASRNASFSTGFVSDAKGATPPNSYTLFWDDVSMADVRMHYDSRQDVTVGSGSTGAGASYTVQVFSNSVAGLYQVSNTAGQFSWGRFTDWINNSPPYSFRGERADVAGGAGDYSFWNTGLTLSTITDPTSVEYVRAIQSVQDAQFLNGAVTATYNGGITAIARSVNYQYSTTNETVTAATQGTFTGPDGTTVAKLESYDGTNRLVGSTWDGQEIWLHPLLTALGIPLTNPIIPTFAVRTFVRPTVEALYTFANLSGPAEPDGWGVGTYVNAGFNETMLFVGSLSQTWTLFNTQNTTLDRKPPSFGSTPLDQAVWTGSASPSSLWTDRNGFSFDLNSGTTADVLTATRNDCP